MSSPVAGITSEDEFGANEWLVDEMYERYIVDKNSVDQSWWPVLEQRRLGVPAVEAPAADAAAEAPAAAAPVAEAPAAEVPAGETPAADAPEAPAAEAPPAAETPAAETLSLIHI